MIMMIVAIVDIVLLVMDRTGGRPGCCSQDHQRNSRGCRGCCKLSTALVFFLFSSQNFVVPNFKQFKLCILNVAVLICF